MDAVVKRCFALIFVGAFAFAQTAEAMPPSDTTTPSGASEAELKAPRHKAHLSAQAMQAIYLKGLMLGAQKAARAAKVTSCLLSVWYTDDGTVQVVQLVKTSGLPMVDQACLQGSIGQRLEGMLPGESGGREYISIYWVFDAKEADAPQRPRIQLDRSIPQLPADGGIHPLPNYPVEAQAQRAHGICKMHITVSAEGVASSIEITQSTGSVSLDEACRQAVSQSAFVPAISGGRPMTGATDVAIVWRMPR